MDGVPEPKNPIEPHNAEVIVLLHGLLATSSYWNRISKRLRSAGFQVIAIDLLGFGTAKHVPATEYTYQEHVDYIHQQLNDLHLTKPFVLAGHSMGALLATRYSLEHQTDVKKLFLFNPPLYLNAQQARTTLRDTNGIYRFLLDSAYKNLGWNMLKRLPGNLIGDHSVLARDLSIRHVIESAEFIGDLKKLTTTTILMVGKNDRPIYQQNLKSISLPNNIQTVLVDVSHHSPILKPKLVAHFLLS